MDAKVHQVVCPAIDPAAAFYESSLDHGIPRMRAVK